MYSKPAGAALGAAAVTALALAGTGGQKEDNKVDPFNSDRAIVRTVDSKRNSTASPVSVDPHPFKYATGTILGKHGSGSGSFVNVKNRKTGKDEILFITNEHNVFVKRLVADPSAPSGKKLVRLDNSTKGKFNLRPYNGRLHVDPKPYIAEVVFTDRKRDVAGLKIVDYNGLKAPTTLSLRNTIRHPIHIGEKLHNFAANAGMRDWYSSGEVSHTEATVNNASDQILIGTTLPINFGSSGSFLVAYRELPSGEKTPEAIAQVFGTFPNANNVAFGREIQLVKEALEENGYDAMQPDEQAFFDKTNTDRLSGYVHPVPITGNLLPLSVLTSLTQAKHHADGAPHRAINRRHELRMSSKAYMQRLKQMPYAK